MSLKNKIRYKVWAFYHGNNVYIKLLNTALFAAILLTLLLKS